MRRPVLLPFLLLFVLTVGATPTAAAPRSKAGGTFGAWTTYTGIESGKKVCYAVSYPKKMEGKYKVRGKAYVIVTVRPAVKSFAVVAVEAGYPYKADSEVQVEIDGKTFSLFTRNRPEDGDGDAWARSDDDDKALTAAMKAGNAMIVRGTSSRGTVTTDTYSLSGFTKAHDAMVRACK